MAEPVRAGCSRGSERVLFVLVSGCRAILMTRVDARSNGVRTPFTITERRTGPGMLRHSGSDLAFRSQSDVC